MAIKKNYLSQRSEYTVSYTGMRGVDFSSDGIRAKRYRFAHLENMYKDYNGDGEGITESIPGYRKLTSVYKRIHAIYSHKDNAGNEYIVVHAKDSLYRFAVSERDSLSSLKPIMTLRNTKSHAFTSGNDLFILDGENIVRIRGNGECSYVTDTAAAAPYIPTTYVNGVEYEQRNLLTDKFREKFTVTAASDLVAATEGLSYTIISGEEKAASVTGIDASVSGTVYIPSYVNIGSERYRVTEIADSAFYANKNISSVILSDTVKRIGKMAFISCTSLTEFISRNSLEVIDNNAFVGCTALKKLHLGTGLTRIGIAAFGSCQALKEIDYAGDKATFVTIDIEVSMDIYTINYGVKYSLMNVEIPIFSPALSIYSVDVGGSSTQYYTSKINGIISGVTIPCDSSDALNGKEVVILGEMDGAKFTKNSVGTNFISENGGNISGKAAILGCRVCECFDGRVFVSGNPELPNTVFYTSRDESGRNNPLYFGVLNYFNDGIGGFTVESMLATGESLAVFKSGDDGSGSIYYHTPRETGVDILPKIYPVSYIHSGISAVGESISFFDDPIFISSLGCTALDKRMINLERSISTRSGNVNAKLLSEDLKAISMTKWCGYLVVEAGEHIYLADSRDVFTNDSGNAEYEWYYLSGIGAYRGANRIFKYSEAARPGYLTHPTKINEEVDGEVYMTTNDIGEVIYYSPEGEKSYEVYTNGEMRGGSFSPACCVYSTENDLLFFGTEAGDICIFNNDMRGVAPYFIAEQEDFYENEYRKNFGRRIHPYFYSFDSHAPLYAVKTVSDDGGIPHFTKSTVKGSLTLKLRCLGNGSVCCEVGTEHSGYKEIARLPDSALNFAELDFSAFSFSNRESVTVPLKEREKAWIEKNISIYSNEYTSPFGIYSITYRFTVKGKIKH